MSKTSHLASSRDPTQTAAVPRAMIHKRILDAAAAQPTASLETLAAEVMGASVGLVDRVLEEYGDPAVQATETETEPSETNTPEDQYDPPPASTEGPMTEQDAHDITEPASTTETEPAPTPAIVPATETAPTIATGSETAIAAESDATIATTPALTELTEKQQTALRAVYEHPEATQRELADRLDISDSAVSLRLRNIDEFEWDQRQAFVTAIFDNETMSQETTEPNQHAVQELTERIDVISQHIKTLEHRLDDRDAPSQTVFAEPELVHKIANACLMSEVITEEEELHILKELLSQS